ncbi:aflatoxin regulatory protein-domain-containing protein [Biscogniauxia mediterranea]|nr:aflatoxin regulatory protein-domain-containing protein [Biscogniauxia mediterranea]
MSSSGHGNLVFPNSASSVPALAASTSPPTPKLKDSCHNCATAKLRCSKEKPTCSRCEKQGKKCQYLATKRAGRKRVSSLNSRSSSTSSPGSMQIPLTQSTSHPTATASSLYLDIISSLSPSIELVSTPIPNSPDFFASWISLPPADVTMADSGGNNLGNYSSYDTVPISNVMGTSAKLPGSALSATMAKTYSDSVTLPITSSPSEGSSEKSPSCISRATDILHQLCSHDPRLFDKKTHRPPDDTQGIVERSRHVLDGVKDILDCSCSRYGYTLATVYLIILQVLDRYTSAAAQKTTTTKNKPMPNSHDNDTGEHNNNVHASSHTTVSAQLLLGELYRAQGVFAILSQRLQSLGGRGPGLGDMSDSRQAAHCGAVVSDGEDSLDLPPAMLAQAELDLSSRLHALSVRLTNMSRENW